MASPPSSAPSAGQTQRQTLDSVVIRFAGDSGDGMQLTGGQFTHATAREGNDLATFPDFPAEIRAPAGTTFGVSGYQIHFADHDILTPGDQPDVLVAMNPAALKVSLPSLRKGGLLIVNAGAFTKRNLDKAGYDDNPLEGADIEAYRTLALDISKLTLESVKEYGLGSKAALRCKNFWTLGLMYWMFDRDRAATVEWLQHKFGTKPDLAAANIAALNAGHIYGQTAELPSGVGFYTVPSAKLEPGLYRNINGNEATAWGLVAGTQLSGLPMMYGSYPITPASSLLHHLAALKNFNVTTFQAEDEIAAVCSAIGASFGGALGVTGTSGPGVALKAEAIGLAIAAELPLVIVNVQRAGPSTGLPTKTEQSDLMQALYGRNGDAPLVVLAAASPSDCFAMAIESVRVATKFMTPVMLLTDGYLANGAEPWKIPDFDAMQRFDVHLHTDPKGFQPFARDPETLARNWAVPGTPGLMHRVGGLERDYDTGHISYDADNHERMTQVRVDKVAGVAKDWPEQRVEAGDESGDLLVIGWGSTYGAIKQAVTRVRAEGGRVSHAHLRHLWPLPRGLEALMRRFKQVLVPEMNTGMLVKLLRSELPVQAEGLSQVTGQPFKVSDLEQAIWARVGGRKRKGAA